MKKYLILLLFIPLTGYSQSEDFIKYTILETGRLHAVISNDGRLGPRIYYSNAITWPKENGESLVYNHGLWIFGYQNNELICAGGYRGPNY